MNGGSTLGLRLFERHFDRLHSLFRLCLPEAEVAQEALLATLSDVAASADEIGSRSESEITRWVDDIALAQLAHRHQVAVRPHPGSTSAPPRRPLVPEERDLLDSLDDKTLAILVRGLPRETRMAVALGLVHGIDRRRVALVLGCSPERVDALQHGALGQLADLLSRHQHERFKQPARPNVLARTTAPHLRPLPGGSSDGIIVVRGTKAMIMPGPPQTLHDLVLAFVQRVVERIRRRQIEHHFDDEVGTSGDARSRRAPAPTPTTRPLAKPKRTPTLRDYRKPETTRGTATHERSPKKTTPGTQGIGAPRRALSGGSNTYGWTQNGGRARGR